MSEEENKTPSLSKIYEAITQMRVDIARLATILELRKQPCQWYHALKEKLDKHIDEHDKAKRDIKRTIMQIAAAVTASGIIGIIGIVVGMRLQG